MTNKITKSDAAVTKAPKASQDSLFKMLTWRSPALTGMFDLPGIVGLPHQQELNKPQRRITDRFYKLADGTYLHVEHQTNLRDERVLAQRMIEYRMLILPHLPKNAHLHQVVIFTGKLPRDRTKIPLRLCYKEESSQVDLQMNYSIPLKDLRGEPKETFTRSGAVDDLLLGVLGSGPEDLDYCNMVATRIRAMRRGEAQREAKEKFLAVCAIVGLSVDQLVGDIRMWIEDVKDNSIVKEIVRIAGREEREGAERRARLEERRSNLLKLLRKALSMDGDELAAVATMGEAELDVVSEAALAYAVDKANVDALNLIDNALGRSSVPKPS